MRARFLPGRSIAAAACATALFWTTIGAQDQQVPFKSGASTVAVYATVTDATGRLVPDLNKDDFEIYDNGKRQPISLFANEVQPITIVVMLDRSGSMRQSFHLVAAGAEEFVNKLLPEDKARIGSFAARIEISPEEFTSDKRALIEILHSEMPPQGPTPLWNATYKAMSALANQDGRRVVLLFTDGVDSPMNFRTNNLSVMDVVGRATREDMMVYAIGLESSMPYGRRQSPMGGRSGGLGGFGGFHGGFEGRNGHGMTQRPDPGLPRIAEDTGGGYFELTNTDDLPSTFARIADELHHQYALGFEPTKLDGKVHDLEIKVKGKGKGLKVRARRSYAAAKPVGTSN
jgi:Ca-activated chloride channel homolog